MEAIESSTMIDMIQRALNMIDPRLLDHGKRVSYLVHHILKVSGKYNEKERREICILTTFHDIGAYKTDEIDKMVQFETSHVWNHSIYGYLFLKYLTPLKELASGVLFHHYDYDKLKKQKDPNIEIANIINLADRIEIYLSYKSDWIERDFLDRYRDKRFASDYIDWFWQANENHILEKNLISGAYQKELNQQIYNMSFTKGEIHQYLNMLVYAIDFRSEFTVIHTINTVGISLEIAKLCAMKEEELEKIQYGALLHDMGKIAIPIEILENPGKLSDEEMEQMKTHVNRTYDIIKNSVEEEICKIAIRHHEKLDGSGYPFGLAGKELTKAQRIVGISDIMSALSGSRSYKKPFPKEKVIQILLEMKDQNKIDSEIVDIIVKHYDQIMQNSEKGCNEVLHIYLNIKNEFQELFEQLSVL